MNYFLPIQILLLIFLLFVITRVILRFREGTISLGMFLFWTGFWALATLSVIQPDFTTFVAQRAGIGRGADAVIYGSLIIIFYLIFRLMVMIENVRHEVTKLIREIALSDSHPKRKSNKK